MKSKWPYTYPKQIPFHYNKVYLRLFSRHIVEESVEVDPPLQPNRLRYLLMTNGIVYCLCELTNSRRFCCMKRYETNPQSMTMRSEVTSLEESVAQQFSNRIHSLFNSRVAISTLEPWPHPLPTAHTHHHSHDHTRLTQTHLLFSYISSPPILPSDPLMQSVCFLTQFERIDSSAF